MPARLTEGSHAATIAATTAATIRRLASAQGWRIRQGMSQEMQDDSSPDAEAEAYATRRAAATAALRRDTGIDEAMIERLIRAFYGRVMKDPLIGPVFAERITDWEPHLQKMFAFWSSVALLTGAYHGRPMQAHATMPVDGAHFDRWLEIFAATARDLCPPAAARHFIEKAQLIARSLEAGIATVNGVRLAPGERYCNRALRQVSRA